MESTRHKPCPRCSGRGKVPIQPGAEANCGRCAGSGEVQVIELRFKVGDAVKLTDVARMKYGYGPRQGQGGSGVVVSLRDDDESPGATRPYLIKWETHHQANSYADEDLVAGVPAGEPAARFAVVK